MRDQPTDRSVWRVLGDPLVAGVTDGPLAGERVAVKDLFAVAGWPVGGGVPRLLAERAPAAEHAEAVARLLDAGADVRGIAQTDELAYSIAGRNPHYGTPPNPAVPDAIPGGSSSGPASAVALGEASIGLGTDTGGSIRVPASYQGLWGLRTTHGAVPVAGLVPLARSFDTVGWLTREVEALRGAAAVSLAPVRQGSTAAPAPAAGISPSITPAGGRAGSAGFAVARALVEQATPEVRAAFDDAIGRLRAAGDVEDVVALDVGDVDVLVGVFRVIQAAEAWRAHGGWIVRNPGALGADVAARFRWASTVTAADEQAARATCRTLVERLEADLGDRILLLPSASSAAPDLGSDATAGERTRAATLRLTCLAGLTGRPALSVPVLGVPHPSVAWSAPVGLCLVGPRSSDLGLLDVGQRFAAALGEVTGARRNAAETT